MERRNRLIIAALICAVLVVAIFYSFSVNIFSDTPEIQLPTLDAGGEHGESGEQGGTGAVQVAVTAETVQSVIATLSRYGSYSRGVLIEYFWGEDQRGAVTAQVAVDGGWTRVDLTSPSGAIEHTITDGETWYLWYGGGSQVQTLTADRLTADLAQRMPTYEDVLELEVSQITGTGYEERGGLACVYVEAQRGEGDLLRYWISVESGLLVSAEQVSGGALVYRMTAYEVVSPLTQEGQFTLPDGTVLHQILRESPEG